MAETENKKDVTTQKKKFYKKRGFWIVIAILAVIGIASPKTPDQTNANSDTSKQAGTETPVATPEASPATPVETKPVEPVVPTEHKSALAKADSYANRMNMSKRGVYDQLISEYGEQFKPEAAQYAIDNVKADWNANALAKAKSYQDRMHMSPASIRDQLISDYGEKFTPTEADYAIQRLGS